MTTQSDRIKQAEPDHPINDLIARRWSPYALDGSEVTDDQLRSCLEAARWSASSFNEQPWSYIIARRQDTEAFDTMLSCLVEANQAWARNAGVLMIAVVKRHFEKNGKPNRVAEHDLGLAAGNLVLQATELGLHVHQMAGVNLARAKQVYNIPEGYEPWTAIAIGHAAEPDHADDPKLAQRDQAPRSRKPLSQFVFAGKWDQPAPVVAGDGRD